MEMRGKNYYFKKGKIFSLRQNIFKLVAKSHQRTHGQIERILSTYLIEELT